MQIAQWEVDVSVVEATAAARTSGCPRQRVSTSTERGKVGRPGSNWIFPAVALRVVRARVCGGTLDEQLLLLVYAAHVGGGETTSEDLKPSDRAGVKTIWVLICSTADVNVRVKVEFSDARATIEVLDTAVTTRPRSESVRRGEIGLTWWYLDRADWAGGKLWG